MKFHPEQLKILKELILEYQKTSDGEIFLQILKRVDIMLTEIIIKFSKIYCFNESIQDLYQTGIVGLKRAVDAFKPETKEIAIPMCIFYWTRKEIFETYGIKKFDVSKYMYEHPNSIERTDISSRFVREDVQTTIKDVINSGKLTEEDIYLIILIHIENMSINEILRIFGGRWGKTRVTVNKRVKKVSRILRREFEKKGLGYD